MKLEIGAGALFSEDMAHRFALWRIWRLDVPPVMLIGLNPSTANDKTDDPTIRRIRGLAKGNGFGGFYMTNLYSFVTAYPDLLERSIEQLQKNDLILKQVSEMCEEVVFCWGNFKVRGRDEDILKMFPYAQCFGKNKNGSQKHPLYLPGDTKIKPFNI